MKIDKDFIEENLASGYLCRQKHPQLPLWIYNYTAKTQYEKKWSEVMMFCRGLIVDKDYNIIGGGLKKFFNYQELYEVPNLPFDAYEKYDGSLIVVCHYEGRMIIASKGSFTSEQALKAKEILKRKEEEFSIPPVGTFYFEVIYPENRIVVNYGEERLVLLTGFNNNLVELERSWLFDIATDVAKRYDFKDFDEVLKHNQDNFEGFIIRWANGLRCKVKLEEYVRLHRIMTNFSTREIFEYVKEGKDLNPILEGIPDEFYNFVKETVEWIKNRFMDIAAEAQSKYIDILSGFSSGYSKKEFALAVQASGFQNSGLLYTLDNKKNISPQVWKIVGNELEYRQPFKTRIEKHEE